MNIGIFSEVYKPVQNGVVNIISSVKKDLEKKGHKVHIFTAGIPFNEKNTHYSKRLNISQGYGVPVPFYNKKFINELQIIHTHQIMILGVYAMIISKKRKIPLVLTSNIKYDEYIKYSLNLNIFLSKIYKLYLSFVKYYLNKCDKIILPSESYKEEFIKKYNLSKEKIEIIPNFHDLKKVEISKVEKIKKRYNLQNKKVIISVGRLSPEKNFEFLLKVFSEVCKKRDNVVLMIIGNGPEKEALKNLCKNLKIDENVFFVGGENHTELSKYYYLSDIFISASKTEMHPLSIIEAMSMKNASVTSKITGFIDIVKDKKTGFLIEGENLKKFVEKIILLIDDNQLLEKMKNESYSISKNFSSIYHLQKLEKLYQKMITENEINRQQKCQNNKY